jgi:hypothetical protein
MNSINRVLPINPHQFQELIEFPMDESQKPARIMCRGKSVNLCTGLLVGGNVIYQMVYWDRPKEFFQRAKAILEENNPGEKFRIEYSD